MVVAVAIAVAATLTVRLVISATDHSRLRSEVKLLEAEGGSANVLDLLPRPLGRKPGAPVALLTAEQFSWPYPKVGQGTENADFADANVSEAAKIGRAFGEYTSWLPSAYGFTVPAAKPNEPVPQRNEAWFPYLEKMTTDNKDSIDFVRRTADGPPAMFKTVWTQGAMITLSHLSRLGRVAKLLSADAAVRLHKGDEAGAVQDVQTVLKLRLLIDDDPVALSKLTAFRMDSVAFETLMMILSKGHPDRAAIGKVLQELDGREKRNRLTAMLFGETAIDMDTFRTMGKDMETFLLMTEGSVANPLSLEKQVRTWLHMAAWHRTADECSFLKAMREIRARSRMEFPQILDGIAHHTPAPASGTPFTALTPDLIRALPGLFYEEAGADARVRITRAAVALYLYRMDTGTFPATLDALIPKYLKESQTDPYSGKPLIYRQTKGGYLLYSIGEDRKDDGGNPTVDVTWQCDAPQSTGKPQGQ